MYYNIEKYNLKDRTFFWDKGKIFQSFLNVFRIIKHYDVFANATLNNKRMSCSRAKSIINGSLLKSMGSYDAILSHFGPNGVIANELRQVGATNAPILTFFHGYDVTKLLQEELSDPYAALKKDGELFLAVSGLISRRLHELGFPMDKIVTHRMGIDLVRYPFSPRRVPDDGKIVFASVGRLVEKKGFEYGLRAFAKVQSSCFQTIYRIAGDGPLRQKLEQLAKELGIEDRVEFLGWQSQERVQELLSQAQIFMAPSVTSSNGDQEGIPVTLMEAMASGLPVVSTFHSGIPELVAHGQTGWLAAERDVASLHACLQHILDNPEKILPVAKQARAFVEKHHDGEKLNRDLLGHIRSFVGQGPS